MITPIDDTGRVVLWLALATMLTLIIGPIVLLLLRHSKRESGRYFESEENIWAVVGLVMVPLTMWIGLLIASRVGEFSQVTVEGVVTKVNGVAVVIEGIDRHLEFVEDPAIAPGDFIHVRCTNPERLFDCTAP